MTWKQQKKLSMKGTLYDLERVRPKSILEFSPAVYRLFALQQKQIVDKNLFFHICVLGELKMDLFKLWWPAFN